MQIIVRVRIKFKDDKYEEIDCHDTPYVGGDWITLYPLKDRLSRRIITTQAVEQIIYDYITIK